MIRKSSWITLCALTLSLCLSSTVFADVNDSSTKVKWGYTGNTGPAQWGRLDPGFALCASGKYQSPINIPNKLQKTSSVLALNYNKAPIDIIKDGTTNLTIINQQYIINDGHAIQLNFPSDGPKEEVTYNLKDYRLVQFHFHTPSENQWHSQSFPMEIHFVHQADNGQALVIGVFVKAGNINPEIQKIIDNLPADQGKEHVIKGTAINPLELLPSAYEYYGFLGSLTTPPCAESLQWVVMTGAINASSAQIMKLRTAMGGVNARPVQPLNGRMVYLAH